MVHISLETAVQKEYNPFQVNLSDIDKIINAGFKKISLLDTNMFINNSNTYADKHQRRYNEDEQSFDARTFSILADRNSSAFTTGMTLTELLGLDYQRTMEALEKVPHFTEKILNVYDDRISNPLSSRNSKKRRNGASYQNIKEFVKYPYGVISSDKQVESLYKEATIAFNKAMTIEDKDTATFQYFMTAAMDAARNIETEKDQDNIFCDAYNFAFGLLLGSKINETDSNSTIALVSNDEDIGKIYEQIWDNLETNSYRMDPSEKELRDKLDSAIEYISKIESKIAFKKRMSDSKERYVA